MDTESSGDRRRHPRTRVTLKVDYPSADGFVRDYTINISRGGTMLRTNRNLQVGDWVEFVLSFPGLLEAVSLRGEVRWVRPEAEEELTVGVAFELDDNKHTRLEALVQSLKQGDPNVVAPSVRVLVVEDNAYVARLIRDGLAGYHKRTGDQTTFTTTHARDGREALGILVEGNDVDLLIVDMYLPVMDGASLIGAVRNEPRWKHLPIIAVSAGAKEAEELALSAGADIFLDKPFRLADVLDTMRRLLASGSSPRP